MGESMIVVRSGQILAADERDEVVDAHFDDVAWDYFATERRAAQLGHGLHYINYSGLLLNRRPL